MEEQFLSDTVEKKQYLTDIVGEGFKRWERGDLIFLKTPTGSGKTTFIIHKYAAWLVENRHNILILVPRTILKEQLDRELKKVRAKNVENYENFLNSIQVWTYHHLEKLKQNKDFSVPNFFSIVCDEAHYFLDDSTFNSNTELSYKYVIRECELRLSTLVVMSATLDNIQSIFLSDLPQKKFSKKEQMKRYGC